MISSTSSLTFMSIRKYQFQSRKEGTKWRVPSWRQSLLLQSFPVKALPDKQDHKVKQVHKALPDRRVLLDFLNTDIARDALLLRRNLGGGVRN